MTTSTTAQTLGHRNITSIGSGGRIAILVAGSALAVAVIGVAVQPDNGSAGSNAMANVQPQRSALVDGPAFQTAISATIANIEAPRSALLDGLALQAAINATIANVEAPRSALLDGLALQAAIAATLDADAR